MIGTTGVSTTSLELAGAIAAIAAVAAVVDIATKPGWAWKAAGRHRTAALALAILIPVLGPALYAIRERPAVAAVAASGRAAALPFEGLTGTDPTPGEVEVPSGFGSFGEQRPTGQVAVPAILAATRPAAGPGPDGTDPDGKDPDAGPTGSTGPSDTFFSTPTSGRRPGGLATRTYRPRQRESFAQAVAPVTADSAVPRVAASSAVPAGWKADPTGRHDYRYWDGNRWTENVATGGVQSLDAAAS